MTQADIKRREAEEAREAAIPGKLAALRGRVGEVVRRWIESSITGSLSLHRAPTQAQQAERFPPLPSGTPKWAEAHVQQARDAAERAAQVVWPAFDEPQPLPPVREGERRAWSFHVGGLNHQVRVFPTVASPSSYCEVFVHRVGDTLKEKRDISHSTTIVQYGTRAGAHQAAHYKLCREACEALYRSLRLCEDAAKPPGKK